MGALGDGSADLVEVELHGMGIGAWHHDGGAGPPRRADGAEDIGTLIALVGRLARPASLAGPQSDDAVLLTQPCLVLPPNLDLRGAPNVTQVGGKRACEVFLNACNTLPLCLG
jgi:hypothetical protein